MSALDVEAAAYAQHRVTVLQARLDGSIIGRRLPLLAKFVVPDMENARSAAVVMAREELRFAFLAGATAAARGCKP